MMQNRSFGFYPCFNPPKNQNDWLKIFKRGTITKKFFFLLGADDSEMREIKKILKKNNQRFRPANHKGKRVNPGNAYESDKVIVPSGHTLVLVECRPKVYTTNLELPDDVIIIDHHGLGDPGFSLPADRFWEASSIGQLYKLLELGTPSERHLLIAARDHCMFQARLGNCPGINPILIKKLGRKQIAKEKGVSEVEVVLCIGEMRQLIEKCPSITIDHQKMVDLRGVTTVGAVYSLEYLCLFEALADTQEAGLIQTRNQDGHAEKIVICNGNHATVDYFVNTWGPEQGLIDIYAVPFRGYAGGYRE